MIYFNNSFSGALNSKINSAVDNVENILDHIAQFFSLTAILIITPLLYAEINIYIGLSFIAISILYLISLTKFRKKVKEASAAEGARNLENVNGKIVFKNINFNYR